MVSGPLTCTIVTCEHNVICHNKFHVISPKILGQITCKSESLRSAFLWSSITVDSLIINSTACRVPIMWPCQAALLGGEVLFAKGVWFVVVEQYYCDATNSLGYVRPSQSNMTLVRVNQPWNSCLSLCTPYVHVSETYILHIVHPAAAVVETEICPQSLVPVRGKGRLKRIGSCHTIHCRENNGKPNLPNYKLFDPGQFSSTSFGSYPLVACTDQQSLHNITYDLLV